MPTERIFQIGEAELARVRELAFVIWPAHYAPIIGPELIPAMVRDIYAIETLMALVFFGMRTLCLRQIGGQTGDTLGALQQASEIAVLLAAAATLT